MTSGSWIQILIRIRIATLVRRALAEVCNVPVLLVPLCVVLVVLLLACLMVILFYIILLWCRPRYCIYANKDIMYRPGLIITLPRSSFIAVAQSLWISPLDGPVSGCEPSKLRVGDLPPQGRRKKSHCANTLLYKRRESNLWSVHRVDARHKRREDPKSR